MAPALTLDHQFSASMRKYRPTITWSGGQITIVVPAATSATAARPQLTFTGQFADTVRKYLKACPAPGMAATKPTTTRTSGSKSSGTKSGTTKPAKATARSGTSTARRSGSGSSSRRKTPAPA